MPLNGDVGQNMHELKHHGKRRPYRQRLAVAVSAAKKAGKYGREGRPVRLAAPGPLDHQPFVRTIASAGPDQAPGLVYADWLDEHGLDQLAAPYRHPTDPGSITGEINQDATWRPAWAKLQLALAQARKIGTAAAISDMRARAEDHRSTHGVWLQDVDRTHTNSGIGLLRSTFVHPTVNMRVAGLPIRLEPLVGHPGYDSGSPPKYFIARFLDSRHFDNGRHHGMRQHGVTVVDFDRARRMMSEADHFHDTNAARHYFGESEHPANLARPGTPARLMAVPHGADPFFRAVAEHPDDAAHRLVLADWLQEQGDPRHLILRGPQGIPPDVTEPHQSAYREKDRDFHYFAPRRSGRVWVRWWPDLPGWARDPLWETDLHPADALAIAEHIGHAHEMPWLRKMAARAGGPGQLARPGAPVRLARHDIPGLWEAVKANPHDDAPWLILADALDEEGRPHTAALMRSLGSGYKATDFMAGRGDLAEHRSFDELADVGHSFGGPLGHSIGTVLGIPIHMRHYTNASVIQHHGMESLDWHPAVSFVKPDRAAAVESEYDGSPSQMARAGTPARLARPPLRHHLLNAVRKSKGRLPLAHPAPADPRPNPILDEWWAGQLKAAGIGGVPPPDPFGGYVPGTQDLRRHPAQDPTALPPLAHGVRGRPGAAPRPGMPRPGKVPYLTPLALPHHEEPPFAEPVHGPGPSLPPVTYLGERIPEGLRVAMPVARHAPPRRPLPPGDVYDMHPHQGGYVPVAKRLPATRPFDVRRHGDVWHPVAERLPDRLSLRGRLRRAVRFVRGAGPFLAQAGENLADAAPWLVLADHAEESGKTALAELLRRIGTEGRATDWGMGPYVIRYSGDEGVTSRYLGSSPFGDRMFYHGHFGSPGELETYVRVSPHTRDHPHTGPSAAVHLYSGNRQVAIHGTPDLGLVRRLLAETEEMPDSWMCGATKPQLDAWLAQREGHGQSQLARGTPVRLAPPEPERFVRPADPYFKPGRWRRLGIATRYDDAGTTASFEVRSHEPVADEFGRWSWGPGEVVRTGLSWDHVKARPGAVPAVPRNRKPGPPAARPAGVGAPVRGGTAGRTRAIRPRPLPPGLAQGLGRRPQGPRRPVRVDEAGRLPGRRPAPGGGRKDPREDRRPEGPRRQGGQAAAPHDRRGGQA
jgi:uncharacterized protein (TIGR02996 family)